MQSNSPLDQLHDIVAAPAISWWPLAIGWWLLGIAVLASLFFSIRWGVTHWKSKAWKREALREFSEISAELSRDYSDLSEHQRILSRLNQLLKRALSKSCKDESILALPPADWCKHLYEAVGALNESDAKSICLGHYQANPVKIDQTNISDLKRWLEKL